MQIKHLTLDEVFHYACLGEFKTMTLEDWVALENKVRQHANELYKEGMHNGMMS